MNCLPRHIATFLVSTSHKRKKYRNKHHIQQRPTLSAREHSSSFEPDNPHQCQEDK
jgi:hypothetical protein